MATHRFTFSQSLQVVLAIGWADFVLKYRGSILGYFWSLIGPLVRFLVILLIFGPYVSSSIPLYPLYLFLGIIIWEHFTVTTNGCMGMLFEKEGIVQRHPFPHFLLILAVGWTNLIIFATHLVIFALFAWYFQAHFTLNALLLPLILVQMTFIALGVGMVLASYCLKYRDVCHLWGIAIQILFWLTPIMYPYRAQETATKSIVSFFQQPGFHPLRQYLDLFIHFQPISIIINDARRLALYPGSSGVPTLLHLTGLTLICIMFFLLGKWLFDRRSPYFAQEY
jgi:ABC-type polysaccharide/polyol phosphate export permease